ncbi:unnamed protein product [Cylicocyclus nassatus]|uniref:Uncharacterized protein n=1 Tax=Cylicocyclus nassatus TaxID=53992 RepID=A0AA36DQS6_CYLNA|nr:unnamed protein product [Cylicocyclus nassatus]
MKFFCIIFAMILILSDLTGPSLQKVIEEPWERVLTEHDVRGFCDTSNLPNVGGVWRTPVGKCEWTKIGKKK